MAGENVVTVSGASSKLLMMVVILLALMVAGMGGLGYMMLTGHNPLGGASQPPADLNKANETPPVFVKFDTMVVNLSDPGGALLQVDMAAELPNPDAQARLSSYMPSARSAVIMLLSAMTPDQISSPQGKTELAIRIRQVVNASIAGGNETPVKSVMFTSFIVQRP